jgi:hypothetical protein
MCFMQEADVDTGDKVTIESGMFAGKTGTMVEFDEATGLATVSVEAFGEARETRVPIDDISDAGMEADEAIDRLRDDLSDALDEILRLKTHLWWAERASASSPGRSPSAELLETFEEQRHQWEQGRDRRLAALVERAREAVASVDEDQVRARAIGFREDTLEALREEARDLKDAFLDEHLTEEERRELRASGDESDEPSDLLDEQGAALRAEDRLISEVIDEGLILWQECADLKAIESQEGFAWSAVKPGPVDLSVDPPEEEVPDAPAGTPDPVDVPGPLRAVDRTRDWRAAARKAARGAAATYTETWGTGLVTRGGLVEPFSEARPELEGVDSLNAVIDGILGPLESRLPATLRLLRERCIAVVELGDAYAGGLGYLIAPEQSGGDMALLVGLPPSDEQEAGDGPFQLPMSLRELRSRHGQLLLASVAIGGEIEPLETYMQDESPVTGPGEDYAPGRFVTFGQLDEETYLFFDRDELDARNDPMVGRWSVGGRVSPRRAFWRVLDDVFAQM